MRNKNIDLRRTANRPPFPSRGRREGHAKSNKTIFPCFCTAHDDRIYHWVYRAVLLGIYLSFCKFTTVTDARFIGLENYGKVFQDPTFLHSLWYTVLFTVLSMLLINVLAFAVAMVLTKPVRGKNIFRTVFFMPNLIGGIILGYIWQLLLNGVLAHWGKTLTYSGTYGLMGMIILVCWQQIGYMMIIYISGIQNIPGELIEAAKIDGATPGRYFARSLFRW